MKRENSKLLIPFLIICTLGIILGKLQSTYRNRGEIDPISKIIQQSTFLPIKILNNMAVSIGDFCSGVLKAKSLTEENKKLKITLAKFNQSQMQIIDLKKEIENLKGLIGIKDHYSRQGLIAADIVGYFPYENRITLSVGSNQGISIGNAVIDAKGLMGTIQSIDKTHSQVSLITSPFLKIGAMVQGDPPSVGILRGESPNSVVLESVDDKLPIEMSAIVCTSGYSKKIPRGIPIGSVFEIDNNQNFGLRRIRVFPNARIGNIKVVYVIK